MSAVETLGKYEIRRQLGRGAMGTVYEGWDPIIERQVAIKTVNLPDAADDESAEAIARFRREAQAAGRLNHPNVVGVFDYGETKDLAFIVMEYVDGPPLKSLLDKHERFPMATIERIMNDLLGGLQYSHDHGVVHRDIKPANLMLTTSGQAKIADFGIARIESSSMTQAGTVLGTPAYMSPEQFMGQVVDARTDIYSSGVLLYQLLTGERPFDGGMSAIMHKALNTEAPPPSQISVTAPRAFDEVIRRAMAKRPEDRFASASAFAAAIHAAAHAPVPHAAAGEPEEDPDGGTVIMRIPASTDHDDPVVHGLRDGNGSRGDTSRKTPPPQGLAERTVDPLATGFRLGPRPVPEPVAEPAAKKGISPVILGAGAAGVAVLGGLGYFLFAGSSPPPQEKRPPELTAGESPKPSPSGLTQVQPPVQPPVQPVTPVVPPPVENPSRIAIAPPVVTPLVIAPPIVAPPVITPPAVTPPVITPAIVAPPVITPPVITPSGPDPATARAAIAAYVSGLSCSMVDGDLRDGSGGMSFRITGIGGKSAIDDLSRKLGTATSGLAPPVMRLAQIEPIFCQWADTLRPIAGTFGDGGARLTLEVEKARAWLVKDEWIKPRLVMGDFAGEIRVDYIAKDGSVMHLFPQLADAREKLAADPPRFFQPGTMLRLGDRGPGRPGWQVDKPYGTDMIIAIASSAPLFSAPRPGNGEAGGEYLRDLKFAIDAARNRGVRMLAAALPLETRVR